MGETSTDYRVLLIVGVVGIVALFAMMYTVQPSVTSAPSQSFLGAATTLPAYSLMDYNSDGKISEFDSGLLADSIALDSCVAGKVCDIDSNGVLDERDLEKLNSLLSEPVKQSSVKPELSAVTGNAVYIPKQSTIVGYSSVTTILA